MTGELDMSPADCARYDPATGAILEVANMPMCGIDHIRATLGYSYVIGTARLGEHYVSLPDLTIKPRQSCPASLDGLVLSDLPVPCTVVVRDDAGETFESPCDEPTLELEFDFPGTYTVTVLSVPYLDGVFTVEVP